MMYYFFLPFALLRYSEQSLLVKKWGLKLIVLVSLLLVIFLKETNGAKGLFGNIDTESDRIQEYLEMETNFGFFIPVFFHILLILLSYRMHNYSSGNKDYQSSNITLAIWQNTLCQVIFYPLYMLSLTFSRLMTVSSIILLSYQGLYDLHFTNKQRVVLFRISILMLIAYYYRQFVIGNLWEISVVPLFKL